MKNVIFILIFLANYLSLSSQNLSNCNIVEWTLDDLNGTFQNGFDFGSLVHANCGCSQSSLVASNCVLVRIRLVKTVNGQLYNHSCTQLLYRGSWFSGRPTGNGTNYDFVDIYNPSNCGKYTEQSVWGNNQDSYQLPFTTSPGGTVEFLVCRGSDPSLMKGYFTSQTWCTNTGIVSTSLTPTPPNPPGVNPSRPTTILQAQIGSYPVDITYHPKAFCYQNGSVGQVMSDCSSCNYGPCVVVQLVKTNMRGDMNEKLTINTKDLNNFLKSKNGKYNSNAFVFKDGSISDKLSITNGPGKTKGRKISIKIGN